MPPRARADTPSRPETATRTYKPIKHKGFTFELRQADLTATDIAKMTVYVRQLKRGQAGVSMDLLDLLFAPEAIVELERGIVAGKLDLSDSVHLVVKAVEARSGRPTK